MAYHFFKKTVIGSGSDASHVNNFDLMWYDWVTFMTQYNYTVVGSSDGSTFSTTDGSKLSSSSVYMNTNMWFVLNCTLSGKRRQYVIYKSGNNLARRMLYSVQGFSMSNPGYLGSNISATNPPQALDAIPIDPLVSSPYNAITNGYTPTNMIYGLGNSTYSKWTYVFCVDDITGAWYIMAYHYNSSNNPMFMIGLDALSECDSSDNDPNVLITLFSSYSGANINDVFPSQNNWTINATTPFKTWMNRPVSFTALSDTQTDTISRSKFLGPGACVGTNFIIKYNLTGNSQLPSGIGSTTQFLKDPVNGYLQILPVYYIYRLTESSAYSVIKGKSSFLNIPTNFRYINTLSSANSLRNYYVLTNNSYQNYPTLIIPWNGDPA